MLCMILFMTYNNVKFKIAKIEPNFWESILDIDQESKVLSLFWFCGKKREFFWQIWPKLSKWLDWLRLKQLLRMENLWEKLAKYSVAVGTEVLRSIMKKVAKLSLSAPSLVRWNASQTKDR